MARSGPNGGPNRDHPCVPNDLRTRTSNTVAGGASWRISESVVEAGSGQPAFEDTKTGAGKRTVQLPEPARQLLLAIRKSRPDTTFVAESRRARQKALAL